MKQGKTLLVLLVLLILCGGVYFALRSYNENQEDVDDTIYLTDLGEVTTLSFTGTDGSDLSFTKADDVWTWNGDSTFPADQDALDALAEDLGQLATVRVFDEPDSLDSYGLDAPALSCTAANADGDTVTVLLGDEVDGNHYAMVEGESRVATVAATLADELQVSLMDLAEPENIPDVTQGTLASIRWQSGDTDLLLEKETITEETTDDAGETSTNTTYAWTVNGVDIPEDNSTLNDLVSELTYLYFTSCYDYKADADTLAACGLDDPSLLTMTEEDGTVITLSIGSTTDDGGYYYAILNDSSAIHRLSVSVVETLTGLTQDQLTAEPEAAE